MTAADRPQIWFSVRLDLERRELRRRGSLVALPPALRGPRDSRAACGRVVSRDNCAGSLWPDGVFVDHERGSALREPRRRAGRHRARASRHCRAPVIGCSPAWKRFPSEPRPRERESRSGLPSPSRAVLLSPRRPRRRGHAGARDAGERSGASLPAPAFGPAFRISGAGLLPRVRRLLDMGPRVGGAAWTCSRTRRKGRRVRAGPYSIADAAMRLGERGVLDSDRAFPRPEGRARGARIEGRAEPLVSCGIEAELRLGLGRCRAREPRARALDPDLTEAQLGYARLLSAAGRHRERYGRSVKRKPDIRAAPRS
jgi:hypothetical protein